MSSSSPKEGEELVEISFEEMMDLEELDGASALDLLDQEEELGADSEGQEQLEALDLDSFEDLMSDDEEDVVTEEKIEVAADTPVTPAPEDPSDALSEDEETFAEAAESDEAEADGEFFEDHGVHCDDKGVVLLNEQDLADSSGQTEPEISAEEQTTEPQLEESEPEDEEIEVEIEIEDDSEDAEAEDFDGEDSDEEEIEVEIEFEEEESVEAEAVALGTPSLSSDDVVSTSEDQVVQLQKEDLFSEQSLGIIVLGPEDLYQRPVISDTEVEALGYALNDQGVILLGSEHLAQTESIEEEEEVEEKTKKGKKKKKKGAKKGSGAGDRSARPAPRPAGKSEESKAFDRKLRMWCLYVTIFCLLGFVVVNYFKYSWTLISQAEYDRMVQNSGGSLSLKQKMKFRTEADWYTHWYGRQLLTPNGYEKASANVGFLTFLFYEDSEDPNEGNDYIIEEEPQEAVE